ncbi:hypothetical protein [Luteimonas sp. R10]|uniref:hypothetical protein n=1 Tax=Luteimonas sp. R10 TaxID=3108176 RepID=UPI0030932FDC|nr:hypothetical protein U3649_13710 [Luteimonas sp. R10]
MIEPAASPVRHSPVQADDIDQSKVDGALRNIQADSITGQSALANALSNPDLNQAERNEILQTLARGDENHLLAFYANDASRTRDDQYASLGEDQRIIGEALQQAYEDGAITADDLLRISDVNQSGNGGQRFLTTLQNGGGAPGGTVEALSDALWQRNGNDGLDRAGAAIGYTSDPGLQSRNLNTAEKRLEAFEALVQLNQDDPYSGMYAGVSGTIWQNTALASAGRLFISHSSELIDHYTGAGGDTAQTETLANFISQTVFNPDARGIVLNRSQDLVPAVQSALGTTAGQLLDGAGAAEPGSLEQERLIAQFGRLTASISGGAAVALTEYTDQINANQESREQFAGMVSTLVGETPIGKVPGSGDAVTELAGLVYDAINENPERPDSALAGVLYDSYAGQVEALSTELDQTGLRSAFDSAYSAELLNLQQNLNVNLGGHAE